MKRKEEMGREGSAATLANPRNPRKPPKSAPKGARAKAKSRKVRAKKVRTAADARVKETTPDPETRVGVERFVDTVEMLYRRRQIDARQYQAAETYREAMEKVESGIPCTLDTSRVRGGGIATSPTEAQLWAAALLGEAERILGKIDGRIVSLVVSGSGLREVAVKMFGLNGAQVTEPDWKHAGRRLREALTVLADTWWPQPPSGRIRVVRDDTPMADAGDRAGVIEAGRVAHASRGRVRFSD